MARLARLVRSVDFERVLRSRSQAQTAHFALHHVAGVPSRAARAAVASLVSTELSTGVAQGCPMPVDESSAGGAVFALDPLPSTHWLGAVVPKRHARRAVTRTLLKRQIRAAAERHGARLLPGLWVVRLRAPFDRKVFFSASSIPLRELARAELERAFAAASEMTSLRATAITPAAAT